MYMKKEILEFPREIFKDNNLTFLEAVIEHLKDKKGLSFREISRTIFRDERNVWTIYNRVKKKRLNNG